MKNNHKPSTSPESSAATEGAGKPSPDSPPQGTPPTANDLGLGIDRPGFDLGGSSADTHAGTGLGLGKDASDTPGDRRLPGRRLENELTIPRWSGPASHDTDAPVEKTAGTGTAAVSEKTKHR